MSVPAADNPVANSGGSGAVSGTVSPPAGTSISSGTASESLLKAAMASESSSGAPTSGAPQAGDTSAPAGGAAASGATSGASGQPAQTGQPAAPAAAARGEAPDNRIQAAVRNARSNVLESMGFRADADTREVARAVRSALALVDRLSTPEKARAFYAEMGQRLGPAAKTGQPAAAEEYPEPDLVSDDGKYKTYSVGKMQQAMEVHGNKVRAAVLQELKPVLEAVNGIQSERQTLAAEGQSREVTGRVLTYARSLPHFTKENEPEILSLMRGMDPALREEVGPIGAMMMAYGQLLSKRVFPSIESTVETRLRAEYAKSATGSAAHIAPAASGTVSKPAQLRGVDDLAKHMEKLAAAAG